MIRVSIVFFNVRALVGPFNHEKALYTFSVIENLHEGLFETLVKGPKSRMPVTSQLGRSEL